MIQVSTEVANALNQNSRQFDAKIYVNGSAVNCEIMSLKLHKGACGKFTVGSIFIPYVEMTLGGNVTLNAEFELKIAIKLESGWSTYYRMGYFKPTSVENSKTKTEIYAQGRLADTNGTLFDTEPTNRTLQNVLTSIRNKGYTVDLKGLTIPSASIDQLLPMIGLTVRDGLELLASCSGGYVTEDANGHFVLGKFQHTTPVVVNPDALAQYPAIKGEYHLTGIRVIASESLSWDIGEDINFEINNPYFNSQMVSTFEANTLGFDFSVSDMPIALGDFRFEPWDWITFSETDLYPSDILYPDDTLLPQGTVRPSASLHPSTSLHPHKTAYFVAVPCLTLDFDFDGGLKTTVKAEGDLPEVVGTKTAGPISAQLQAAYDKAVAANNLAAQAVEIAEEALEGGEIEYQRIQFAYGTVDRVVGTWSYSIPTLTSDNPYLWIRYITVTRDEDGNEQPISGSETTPQKTTLLDGVFTFVNAAKNGTATVIDGGSIYTNSITATQINMDNLQTNIARIGSVNGRHIVITSTGFDFMNGSTTFAEMEAAGGPACYITSNYMVIEGIWGSSYVQCTPNASNASHNGRNIYQADSSGYMYFGDSSGYTEVWGRVIFPDIGTSTYAGNARLTTTDYPVNQLLQGTTSSRKIKDDIKANEKFDCTKLYDLEVKQFKFKKDYLNDKRDCRYGIDVIGFVAEEVGEVFPIACDFVDGEAENWNERYMIPAMLSLIQDQHREIEALKEKLQ